MAFQDSFTSRCSSSLNWPSLGFCERGCWPRLDTVRLLKLLMAFVMGAERRDMRGTILRRNATAPRNVIARLGVVGTPPSISSFSFGFCIMRPCGVATNPSRSIASWSSSHLVPFSVMPAVESRLSTNSKSSANPLNVVARMQMSSSHEVAPPLPDPSPRPVRSCRPFRTHCIPLE